MMEIALVIVALAQSGLLWYVLNSQKEERAKLINALISKNPQDMVELQAIDKPRPTFQEKEETMVPLEDLSDEDFMKKVVRGKK